MVDQHGNAASGRVTLRPLVTSSQVDGLSWIEKKLMWASQDCVKCIVGSSWVSSFPGYRCCLDRGAAWGHTLWSAPCHLEVVCGAVRTELEYI